MKSKLIMFIVSVLTFAAYGQEFEKGTIVTVRYDTITDVQIKVINDAKSLQHLTYIGANGIEISPDIETVKCYTRGTDIFCRIYNEGEMMLVKNIAKGNKLNLYIKEQNGSKTYYVEKIYDELIKVPSSSNKFKKVIGDFLSASPQIAEKIKSEELSNIEEIVDLYNKG